MADPGEGPETKLRPRPEGPENVFGHRPTSLISGSGWLGLPLISGSGWPGPLLFQVEWPGSPYLRMNDRVPPLSQVEWPGPLLFQVEWPGPPYLRLNDRVPPPLIWRTGSTTGQGPLLSCSSFAKGMKKSMNLRSFCKTKPLSARFPLTNFNPFRTNFTFFINSFVYLFGHLRRGELTHEHRNNYNYNWSRFHSLDYEQSLFFL